MRVPFRVLFIRVPYYIGDPERDPNFENYQSTKQDGAVVGLMSWILRRVSGVPNSQMRRLLYHAVSVTDIEPLRVQVVLSYGIWYP